MDWYWKRESGGGTMPKEVASCIAIESAIGNPALENVFPSIMKPIPASLIAPIISLFLLLVSPPATSAEESGWAALAKDVGRQGVSLAARFKDDPKVRSALDSLVDAVARNHDGGAVEALGQIQSLAGTVTPAQRELLGEITGNVVALALQRNFHSSDSSTLQGDVGKAIEGLRNGNTVLALSSLRQIARQASLTAEQRKLVGGMVAVYAPGVKEKTEEVKKSLQGLNPFGRK